MIASSSDDPPLPIAYAAARHDGWTAARQAHFLACLARHGSVTAACAAVGKRCTSAYRLRHRPDAAVFAAAWDACLVPRFVASATRQAAAPGVEGRKGGERVEGQDFASPRQDHQLRPTTYDFGAFTRAALRYRARCPRDDAPTGSA